MSQQDLRSIEGGPGKWDLISAFGNANTGQQVVFQCFRNDRSFKIHLDVTIMALEHESGSGDSWNFKARAEMPNGQRKYMKGYYSTQSREGHFEFVE